MAHAVRSPYDREIARLAVPALGTLVAEPLYVLVDTAIVGRLGTDELAGLALASIVLLSVHSLLIFLAYGTTATVARLVGAGRADEAATQSVQGLWLAWLLGLGFTGLIYLFDRELLVLLNGEGRPLEAGLRYLRISLIGLPFMMVWLAGAGVFNGRQDAVTPLRIAVAGALANLVIEVVLIFGLGYGIGASALATVISQIAASLVFVAAVVRWARETGASLRPIRSAIVGLALAGRPLVLRSIALRGSFTLAGAVAATISVADLAAHQIGTQIWATLALALDAVAIAGQALTGRWLGAGDAVRAKAAAVRMVQIDVAVAVLGGLAIFIVRNQLGALFSTDADVIAATATVVVWIAIMSPISGFVFALDGILIGAGDLVYLGRSMLVAAAGFLPLAWWVANSNAGLGGLWASITVFLGLRAILMWNRWRSDRWLVVGETRPER